MSGLNFTAIDVETANSQRASVCAVGIVQVRNGVISETFEWHVTPPTGIDSFHPRNIGIHGITPAMVKEAANSWEDSLEAIGKLAEDYPLVAYNAAFDKSVIHESSRLSGLMPPPNEFHCALALSKRLLTLEKYRLPLVAAKLGIDPFTHHDAGSDAAACAQIVLALSRRHGLLQISDLWPTGRSIGNETTARSTVFSKGHTSSMAELPQADLQADPSHPFYGRQVIMTGDLESFDRWEAMEKIASCGGINGKGVTKKTAFLLVGDGKTHASIDLENGTTKEKKAAAYMAMGQDLTVLTESDFLRLVSTDIPAVLEPETAYVPAFRDEPRAADTGTSENRFTAQRPPGGFTNPVPAPERHHEDPDGQYASAQPHNGATTEGHRSEFFNTQDSDALPEKAGQAVTALLRAGTRMGQRFFGANKN
ncbi:exonuclease domain-containing protein [Arthrobacter sp. zg-Y877]|uniref:exonuclease domain-containing protein n=1 Tax=Arthrobacter sp. zg-Y877 TaxID=3049074 RepID=UPI0025A37162|nr:exonuclease domain-containing protein [Arthrobacter sp. zg-Y877]MDM7990731.1 exonuclease domain-containing protein [Arthrobacter sp. zg-Y877]